ncbi:MAG: peptidoglycan DD-metalloendopeptidase family protein [Prevotellaceae bacterium]|jgi:murein DD-endopeptidase MepM/ murein hydrolase activator NlpD|nr:peptidoglycan DD-metalloendopeptidase family protein [Prevotellaceae bacterium]
MPKKRKYHFNHETLNYEPIIHTIGDYLKRGLVHLFSAFALGVVFFFVINALIDSPEEKILKNKLKQQGVQYEVLNKEIDEVQTVLADLRERDNNLYRVIFQADPPKLDSTYSLNSAYYKQLISKTNSEILVATTKKMDEVREQLYSQSKSYDEIVDLAKDYENRLNNIPAIQPVLNKDLTRVASGYGWRIHPVYHTSRFHSGMDFTAPEGTDVYATGNGKVALAEWKSGYGNCVEIDHGYGYLTLYGHLSKIMVRQGQTVLRGDIIGLIGSTGLSTGPHLHYEVHLNGNVMNPQNYYYLDLSPEEYDRMVQLSNNAGQAMD